MTVLRRPVKVTPREQTIVTAILAAQSNRGIAEALGISEQSVKNRLTHVYRKYGVRNRLELLLVLTHAAG
jgi:two-component system, NarL family, nitrate/nitrite response regulator NarL